MKKYIITLSKTFLKGHPKAGQPTNFKEKYLSGEKIHTIRSGDYWAKVVREVNAGEAILSVREWSGKPYASKQAEIGKHTKLGWQNIRFETIDGIATVIVYNASGNGDVQNLTKNDGLTNEDFKGWFKGDFFGGIIHFTDFRY